MEQELKIEEFYNRPYHSIHRHNKLLNHKQKVILAYATVGTMLFTMGMIIDGIIKLFS